VSDTPSVPPINSASATPATEADRIVVLRMPDGALYALPAAVLEAYRIAPDVASTDETDVQGYATLATMNLSLKVLGIPDTPPPTGDPFANDHLIATITDMERIRRVFGNQLPPGFFNPR
jgi:hypothetical protein